MSFRTTGFVTTLVVKQGENFSSVVQGDDTTADAYGILIVAAADSPYGGNIQVCGKGRATLLDTFSNLLLMDGTLVVIPKSGQAMQYVDPIWPSWRIKVDAAVTNDTSYSVWKIFS